MSSWRTLMAADGRYRSVAIGPDGLSVFLVVDTSGSRGHAGELLQCRYVGAGS